MVVDHTDDDNVFMSCTSSNSSTTTRFYNFGTDNIVVRVFDGMKELERPRVINLHFNSDIDNNCCFLESMICPSRYFQSYFQSHVTRALRSYIFM